MLLQRITALRQRLDSAVRPSTTATLDTDFREVDAALKSAREGRTQHEGTAKQLKKVKEAIVTTTDALHEAEASLNVLASQAGVVAIEEITSSVQRANESPRFGGAKRPGTGKRHIACAKHTHGQPLDVFVAAALGEQSGRLDQEIDLYARRAQQLDPDIAAAEADALRTTQVLEAFEKASDAAAEARQHAELILSRLEEHLTEYAALHLARVALERAKERYRARRQDSLLSRAGGCLLQNANWAGVRGPRHRQ